MFKYDIGVVGACGHVGLPLSLVFANEGLNVLGFEINKYAIDIVNSGKIPFYEQGSQELLDNNLNKTFFITEDHARVSECQSIIIIIGTPIDSDFNVDLSKLAKLLTNLLDNLKKDQLVIFRSTMAPKTTDYVKDFIESKTDFRIGINLFLAFVPERLTQNNAVRELKELPNIIGVYDDRSFEKASKLFKILHPEVIRLRPLEAELAKLFTNSYRAATFALANEYFIISETLGANFYKIRKAMNYNYPRCGVAKPGFAKGPCLGKDSWILLNAIPHFNMSTTLISAAYKINDGLPGFLVYKLKESMNIRNKKIAVLGLTFKRDTDDIRDSLSLKLTNILRNELVNFVTHDPYVDNKDLYSVLNTADVIIIATNHSQYENLNFKNLRDNVLILDIWNVLGQDRFIFTVGEFKNG